jgi:hypothetical protein
VKNFFLSQLISNYTYITSSKIISSLIQLDLISNLICSMLFFLQSFSFRQNLLSLSLNSCIKSIFESYLNFLFVFLILISNLSMHTLPLLFHFFGFWREFTFSYIMIEKWHDIQIFKYLSIKSPIFSFFILFNQCYFFLLLHFFHCVVIMFNFIFCNLNYFLDIFFSWYIHHFVSYPLSDLTLFSSSGYLSLLFFHVIRIFGVSSAFFANNSKCVQMIDWFWLAIGENRVNFH